MNKYLMLPLVLIWFILISATQGNCTHIMGGEITYRFIGYNPATQMNKYEITLKMYRDTINGAVDCSNTMEVEIFNNDSVFSAYTTVTLQNVNNMPIIPPTAAGCAFDPEVGVEECLYSGIVEVANSLQGYHIVSKNYARNDEIINLESPGSTGITFYAFISPTYYQNTSPVFTDLPVPYFCVGEETTILNTAFDPDGDILVFSFESPFDQFESAGDTLAMPIEIIPHANGYSLDQPFGAGGTATINAATGLTTYKATTIGNYVVTVEIKEYRNNVLLSVTRRDLQLIAIDCPPGAAPILETTNGSGQLIYNIEAGDSLCFPITFKDAQGDSIFTNISGAIFDSTIVNPAAKGVSVIGKDSITSNFCWYTGCDQANSKPYLFNVSSTDNACPPRTKNYVYSINVSPFIPIDQINGEPLACQNQTFSYSVKNTPSQFVWNVLGGTLLSGEGTNSISVLWTDPVSGKISVTKSNKCSADTSILDVSIFTPADGNAGADAAICRGDSVQLGIPGNPLYIYKWTPVTGLSNSKISNPKASPNATTTYTLTVSKGPNCTAIQDDVLITVNLSDIDAGPNQELCAGDTIQFSVLNNPDLTYLWTPNLEITSNSISNPKVFPTDTTLYKIQVFDNVTTCAAIDSVLIKVSPKPNAQPGADTLMCQGDTISILAKGGLNYRWFPGKWLSDSISSNPKVFADTNITYGLIAYSGVCTEDTSYKKVTVGKYPIAKAGSDKYICKGDTAFLGTNFTPGYTYTWSPSISLNNTSISNPFAIPDDTILYYLQVKRDSVCFDYDTVKVNVSTIFLKAVAGPDQYYCPGNTVSLNATGGKYFSWTPAILVSNPNIANPIALPDTVVDFIVTVSSGSCISDSDTIRVIPDPVLNLEAGPNRTICLGDSIEFTPTYQIDFKYKWSPDLNITNTEVINPKVSPLDTTDYFLTVTNKTNCKATDTIHVNVYQPILNLGSDKTICLYQNTILNDPPPTANYTYTWTPKSSLSNALAVSPIANPTDNTTYVLLFTDSANCSNRDTITVNVLPIITNAQAGFDKRICPGDSVTLKGTGGNSYWWTPLANSNDTLSKISRVTVKPDTTTSYVLHATQDICSNDQDTIIISVDTVNIKTIEDITICLNDEAKLSAEGGIYYFWSPGISLKDSVGNKVSGNPKAKTTYVVTGMTLDGCFGKDSVTVNVNPLPDIDAGEDVVLAYGESIQLNAQGGMSYQWVPPSDLSNPDIGDPIASPSNDIEYIVFGENFEGCLNTDTLKVEVISSLTAPNVFSPNGDGVNDIYEIKGLIRGSTIFISNRWGRMVYTSTSFNNDWDGKTDDGTNLPSGLYFYVAKQKGNNDVKKGWILLVNN